MGHWAARISSNRFSNSPQRQGRHDVAALAVAFFRDEAPGPVLGWIDHSG